MTHSILRIAGAVAIGVLAAGVPAQAATPAAPSPTPRVTMSATPGTNVPATPSTNAPATTTLPSATPALPQATPALPQAIPETGVSPIPGSTAISTEARRTQATAAFRSAQMRCEALLDEQRLACLREAQAAYDRALQEIQ